MPQTNPPKGEPRERGELLNTIWEEKREKLIGRTDDITTLCIPIPNPQINVPETMDRILHCLSLSPEKSFNWSQNWGRTKVVLGKDENSPVEYLEKGTVVYSNIVPISTTVTTAKYETGDIEPPNSKYTILFNAAPVTIEGAALQIERMVDELVWVTSIQIRDRLGISHEKAYELALEDIIREGINYAYCSEDEILNLREENPNYAVRMYGNVNGKSKVPNVIGAIVPTGVHISTEKYAQPEIIDFSVTEDCVGEQLDFSHLSNEPYITFAMTIGKQPHMGHILLLGVAETAREVLGKETPILMDANDTGPRIIAAIASGAKSMQVDPTVIVEMLNKEEISVQEFEAWYQKRELVGKKELAHAMSVISLDQVHLYQQAQAIEKLLQRIFGCNVTTILESTILDRAHGVTTKCSDGWKNTGFGFYHSGKTVKILEADGIATARTMRTAALITSSLSTGRGTPIYIDGDASVHDALDLYKSVSGRHGHQFAGAGLSINLEIASGTKGNSISFDEVCTILERDLSSTDIINAVSYIVNTRAQILGMDQHLPYFDYASTDALIDDIRRGHSERMHYLESIDTVRKRVNSLVAETAERPSYRSGNKTGKRVNLVHNLKYIVEGKKMDALFVTPTVIEEHHTIKAHIDHARQSMDDTEARLAVYNGLKTSSEQDLSTVVNHFRQHGYEGEQLWTAVEKFVEMNATLVIRKGILYHTIDQIKDILSDTVVLDRNTAQILIDSLNICEQRMR